MTDDKPDFPAEDFNRIATLPQREMVESMKKFGWRVSHLWKKDEGEIVVWCISKTPAQKGYTHAYIEPGGKLIRYNPPRIRIIRDEVDS